MQCQLKPLRGAILLVLVGLGVGTAEAQLERKPSGFGWKQSIPIELTAYEAVQKDLQLDAKSIASLDELRKSRGKSGNYTEIQAKVKGILTSEQITRLRQIQLQLKGNGALADARLGEDLELTAEQYRGIQQVHAEFNKKLIAHLKGGGLDSDDKIASAEAKLQVIRDDQWFHLLTAEQKTAFEKLKGAPFDFSKLSK